METKLAKSIQTKLAQIADLLNGAAKNIAQAGQIIAQIIDDGTTPEEIADGNPWLSVPMIRRLERIGRGTIRPELWSRAGSVWQRIEKMPADVQARAIEDKPFEVFTLEGNGPASLCLTVDRMTPDHGRQVFDAQTGTVRDLGAQRAWLETEMRRKRPLPDEPKDPFRVTGNKMVVLRPCELTIHQLGMVLAQMRG